MKGSMRVRVPAEIIGDVEHLARVEGRSFQNVLDRLLKLGLRAAGATVRDGAASPETEAVRMSVPLPGRIVAQVKQLARQEDRSNRSMARQLVIAGLRAYRPSPSAQSSAAQ